MSSILSSKRTYELPIAREYVRHWSMPEAVREIIQNALDSDSPFEYEFKDHKLYVYSRGVSRPVFTEANISRTVPWQ